MKKTKAGLYFGTLKKGFVPVDLTSDLPEDDILVRVNIPGQPTIEFTGERNRLPPWQEGMRITYEAPGNPFDGTYLCTYVGEDHVELVKVDE